MMTRAEFIGRIAQSLAANAIDKEALDAIAEAVRVVHGDVATTYARQLLIRHRKRAGRRLDHARKKRIAEAAHVARFNRSIGKEEAARQAADAAGLRFNEVYEAAFLYRRKAMRTLMRTIKPTHQQLKVGSQNKKSVVTPKSSHRTE
jgi:hypothetical protein